MDALPRLGRKLVAREPDPLPADEEVRRHRACGLIDTQVVATRTLTDGACRMGE
ncbi:MAG: hypothetical protein MUO35_04575 [Anaerolineales bacterium]|nr:hypothetical protein [Anaerolineales bacterium]